MEFDSEEIFQQIAIETVTANLHAREQVQDEALQLIDQLTEEGPGTRTTLEAAYKLTELISCDLHTMRTMIASDMYDQDELAEAFKDSTDGAFTAVANIYGLLGSWLELNPSK